MEERLQVRIEADVRDLQQGFERAKGIVAGLNQRAKALRANLENATDVKSIAAYNRRLEETQKELARIKSLGKQSFTGVAQGQQQATQSMSAFSNNTSRATGVTMEFNRVIQDAPFGLMGIGNNIQQLTGNFASLSTQVGGTGNALKAMFKQMITGPNLALLAISALTAGFTAYQMGAFDFLKANKEKIKSLEELQEELEAYRKTLEATQQASIEGAQNAQKDIVLLEALARQAQDTALSEQQRTDAVEELQRLYPDYLGNLSKEEIMTGDVSEEIDNLKNSLIESAKAYAAINKIRGNSIALLDLESRATTRAADILEKINGLEKARANDAIRRQALGGRGGAAMAVLSEETRIREEISDLFDEQAKDAELITKINEENLSLQERINQSLANGGNLVKEQVDKIKNVGDAIKEFDASELFRIDSENLRSSLQTSLDNALKEMNDPEVKNIPVKIDFEAEELDPATAIENDRWNELWKQRMEMVQQFAGTLENTLASSFENSLSRGENFFDSIEEGFKRMLAKLASQLAASAVLKILGMIVGGPVGGAIGGQAGSLLSGAFGGFRADGGSVFPGKKYIVGEEGPEIFSPSSAGVIIPNTPSVSSPVPMNNNFGSQNFNVHVTGEVRNDSIVLANKRGQRSMNRFYGINK